MSNLAIGIAIVVALNVWATVVVVRNEEPHTQTLRRQLGLVWLLPVLGATLCLAIHASGQVIASRTRRAGAMRYGSSRGAANDSGFPQAVFFGSTAAQEAGDHGWGGHCGNDGGGDCGGGGGGGGGGD
ncbi:hypothetical protein GLA29479_3793 [Lysobacter antibioticus]|uniref:hypothetical protein n=1 Tax=Lysobacter antibioticus TaxID=84531 RepID=UPI0007174853|nr:hypothetical protein [Lysobacter antibioticus]ALN64644.1 hypothetical protein GLA29479_3793 [Lysobacter antibioticus]